VAGPGGRSVMRWYELVPSNLQHPLRQVGTVSDPASFVFNGSVSPAGDGRDAAVHYNVSGPTQPVAIRARARPGGAPAGYMGQEIGLVTSSAALLDHTCGPSNATAANPGLCRWGDYSGASPDPLNDRVVWGTSQYSGAIGQQPGEIDWLTQNFAVEALPGPIAQATGSPNPATTGQAVTFDSSGTTDPDAAVTHHLWDLDGNGTFETDTGSSPVATHTYSSAGTLTVRFRALDANGDHADTALAVTVKAPPPPGRPSGPSAACLAARKRVSDLVRQIRSLRSHLKHTRNRRTRAHYAAKLKKRRGELAKAQKNALRDCR
jgi:PKD domain